MKFILRRPFSIQINPRKVKTYLIGEYEVPAEIPRDHAEKAKKQHLGFFVVEKKAPENKVAEVPENKSKVAGKSMRRRRTRSKSDK